jgi:hypothetical protein
MLRSHAYTVLCRSKALYFVAGVYLSEAPSPPELLWAVSSNFVESESGPIQNVCKSLAVYCIMYSLQHNNPLHPSHLQSQGGECLTW